MSRLTLYVGFVAFVLLAFIGSALAQKDTFSLVTLDPGHFHAALIQKTEYPELDSRVKVYAPPGEDLDLHLQRINNFNSRTDSPTHWQTDVYQGDDFFSKFLKDKTGDIVVISGNNRKKTDYVLESLNAGFNVYADKPMVSNAKQFKKLQKAIDIARNNNLVLLDMMTERFEVTTILQRELSRTPLVYGQQRHGSVDNPAITRESVHHYFKTVAGQTLQRPAWFFDDDQQGDGLVDVSTHLVDLIQWEAFPEEIIDYKKDLQVDSATRWSTPLTLEQFGKVTKLKTFPDYLHKNVESKSNGKILNVFSNGEINYRIRNIHARVKVSWEFQAPEGGGDSHYSIMRGSLSSLIIRQGEEEKYRPELYVEPLPGKDIEKALKQAVADLQKSYPGLSIKKTGKAWKIVIPEKYKLGHEAHFAQVTQNYLRYMSGEAIPAWEWPNILAKYYVTTQALKIAKTVKAPIIENSGVLDSNAWRSLFNGKNLHGWETYIGPLYSESKKDFDGAPIGLNRDPAGVFSVVKSGGEGVLRVSGEQFGGISTLEEFESYHLQLQFKWGEKKYAPRDEAKRDSGLLYHANGEHGVDWFFWMSSLEMQIQEGDCGDYWGLVGTAVDIKATKNTDGEYIFNPDGTALTFSHESEHDRHVKKIDNGHSEKANGEWNTLDLYVLGDSSIHVVNGVVKLATTRARRKVGDSLTPLTRGKIQIQSEGAEVYYRNIKIRGIDSFPSQLGLPAEL